MLNHFLILSFFLIIFVRLNLPLLSFLPPPLSYQNIQALRSTSPTRSKSSPTGWSALHSCTPTSCPAPRASLPPPSSAPRPSARGGCSIVHRHLLFLLIFCLFFSFMCILYDVCVDIYTAFYLFLMHIHSPVITPSLALFHPLHSLFFTPFTRTAIFTESPCLRRAQAATCFSKRTVVSR